MIAASPDALPHAEVRQETLRVLEATARNGLRARAIGGIAVLLSCPSAARPPLARTYKDIDLAIPRGEHRHASTVLTGVGYVADERFNALHGAHQMLFHDLVNARNVDVIVGVLDMCHRLDFRDSFAADGQTMPIADLLLAKLQIVELTEKDLKDLVALLSDHPIGPAGIDPERVNAVLAGDWGWWRTAVGSLERIETFAAMLEGLATRDCVAERLVELRTAIDRAPKSRGWRLRARVGERVRWYETPEEPSA